MTGTTSTGLGQHQASIRSPRGSLGFSAEQSYRQPPERQTDIVHMIEVERRDRAPHSIIEVTAVSTESRSTWEIVILRAEERDRRRLEGYLREHHSEGLA